MPVQSTRADQRIICLRENSRRESRARTVRLDISVDLLLSEIISSQLTGRSLWESPYWTLDDDSPLRPQIRTAREHLTDFSNWPLLNLSDRTVVQPYAVSLSLLSPSLSFFTRTNNIPRNRGGP